MWVEVRHPEHKQFSVAEMLEHEGPPRDPDAAIAALRTALALGVNHIDTSDFYGPHVTNQIIRKALHPSPNGLVIVTKIDYRRGADGAWLVARSAAELEGAVHDNLRNLGLDASTRSTRGTFACRTNRARWRRRSMRRSRCSPT